MINSLKTINNYLKDLSCIKFILLMTIFSYLFILPFATVLNMLGYTEMGEPSSIKLLSFIAEFIVVVLIAPLIETFIFQLSIIKILRKVKKVGKNNIVIIIISALAFGIQHYYSWTYVLKAFIIGTLLAYSFIIYENKKESAFWVVTAIHSLRNLIAFVLLFLGL